MTPKPLSDYTFNRQSTTAIIKTKIVLIERTTSFSLLFEGTYFCTITNGIFPNKKQTYKNTILSNNSSITIAIKLNNILYQQQVHYNQRLHIILVYKSTNNNKEIKAENNNFIFSLFFLNFFISDWSANALYVWGFQLPEYQYHITTNQLVIQLHPNLVTGTGMTHFL